jgi:hypothetical protein
MRARRTVTTEEKTKDVRQSCPENRYMPASIPIGAIIHKQLQKLSFGRIDCH